MRYLLLSAFTCLLAALSAQSRLSGLSVADYQNGLEELCVLSDPHHLLPLKRLDTLAVNFLLRQDPRDSLLAKALAAYLPAKMVNDPDRAPSDELLLVRWEPLGDSMQREGWRELIDRQALGFLISAQDSLPVEDSLLLRAAFAVRVPRQFPELGMALLFGSVGTQNRLARDWGPFPAGAGRDLPAQQRLGYAPPAWVGMDPATLHDSLGHIVGSGIRAGAFPGAQVMVVRRGKIVYHRAFGFHTYDSLRAVRLTDLYDLASLTKVTGPLPALMRSYGEGRFDLDAPLKQYAPGFRGSNKARLSFREMLAHQAGLRAWIPYWQGTVRGNARYPWKRGWRDTAVNEGAFKGRTFRPDSAAQYPQRIAENLWLHKRYPDQIYRAIRRSPLRGTKEYLYSGLLFYLLPEIVSCLEQEPYEPYLKRYFYHRLGAHSLTYNPLRYFPSRRIVPTEIDTFFRHELLHGTVHDEGAAMMQGVSGNAGLFGTSGDLAKLLQMYLQGGQYGGEYYFPARAIEEFTRYQFPEAQNRRGLGFDKPPLEYQWGESYVAPSASPQSYGHSGYTGTFFWVDPAEELIFIFLSNRVYPSRTNRKLYEMNLRPRMHEAVYQAIR